MPKTKNILEKVPEIDLEQNMILAVTITKVMWNKT
jgi:hypothetical protein